MLAVLLLLSCAAPVPSTGADGTALPTASGAVLDREALAGRPRPSDPWSAARDTPGVVLDRVDVGGSETAQQSLLVARGDGGAGATWTLDGIDVTDPAAPGFAALFLDTSVMDEIAIRTHTIDTRVRTAGVQMALTLPTPGDRWTGRARAVGSLGQSDNLPDGLAGRPFLRSETEAVRELSADAGGPLVRGRLSAWAAVSQRSLRQDAFTGHSDQLSATLFIARARLRAGGADVSLLALRGEKVDEDRDPTSTAEPAARWRQSGPAHLFALSAERAFGGFTLAARVSALRSGFSLEPHAGTAEAAFEDFRGVAQRSYLASTTDRPRDAIGLEATTLRGFAGFRHRLQAGVGHDRSEVETTADWPGNQVLGIERRSVFFRAFELTGFAIPTRGQDSRTEQERTFVFLQDDARRGRLTVAAGLRLERQTGRTLAARVAANPAFPELLPEVAFGDQPRRFEWVDLLPRAAVAWNLDERTSIGADYAEYAATLGASDVGFDGPARETASLTYYWLDWNADGTVQPGELDLLRGRVGASGVDPGQPGASVSAHAIDPALRAPRTRGLALGARHRHARGGASVHLSWRRLEAPLWRPLRDLTTGDYAIRGAVTGELFGERYAVGYYAPAGAVPAGNGRVLENRDGYHQDALTAEIAADARWGRVHAAGWASLTDWREFFTDRERAVQDPTPLEGDPLADGGAVAARPGGLGRGDVAANARFTAGASVRASVGWGVEAGGVLHAREGFPIPYYQVADTGDPTGGAKAVLVAPRLDAFRLPAVVMIDLRLGKVIRAGSGAVTVFVEALNAGNTKATLQVARDVDLPAFDRPREIVRPRLFRGGIEARF
jgi:hypothetical protein